MKSRFIWDGEDAAGLVIVDEEPADPQAEVDAEIARLDRLLEGFEDDEAEDDED